MRVDVLRHAHQPQPGDRARSRLRDRVDVVRQLVPVVASAQRDRACRRLRVGQAACRARPFGTRARRRARSRRAHRRDPSPRSPAASASRRSRPPDSRASSRASSGCRPRGRSTAGPCWCCPRPLRPSPTASRARRPPRARDRSPSACRDCRRLTERTAAVGTNRHQAVVADRSGSVRANRHADAAHLRALTLTRARRSVAPVEERRPAIERVLHERAGDVPALPVRARRAVKAPCLRAS